VGDDTASANQSAAKIDPAGPKNLAFIRRATGARSDGGSNRRGVGTITDDIAAISAAIATDDRADVLLSGRTAPAGKIGS
jgi:hypothetical protein